MEDQNRILIVDDIPENLQVLGGMLEKANYEVLVAPDGMRALETVQKTDVDLILLDVLMPGMNGNEVCRQLKADPKLSKIPVIFISALGMVEQKVLAFQCGAEDYITKPFQLEEVLARVHTHLQLKIYRDQLEQLVETRTRELMQTRDATIASMAILAECRDSETGGHIQRCKKYVQILGEYLFSVGYLNLSQKERDLLYQSVPLHDIGKVGIPDAILNKPGALNPAEFDEMKKHAAYGGNAIAETERVLGTNSFLVYARQLAESHHEKWDGSGYPLGLQGEEIPISARLMALADVYDALTSKRPYKESYTTQEAFRIITQGDGRTKPEHFDPRILDAFQKCRKDFEQVSKSRNE